MSYPSLTSLLCYLYNFYDSRTVFRRVCPKHMKEILMIRVSQTSTKVGPSTASLCSYVWCSAWRRPQLLAVLPQIKTDLHQSMQFEDNRIVSALCSSFRHARHWLGMYQAACCPYELTLILIVILMYLFSQYYSFLDTRNFICMIIHKSLITCFHEISKNWYIYSRLYIM